MRLFSVCIRRSVQSVLCGSSASDSPLRGSLLASLAGARRCAAPLGLDGGRICNYKVHVNSGYGGLSF